jgi:hypothetical protein
VQSYCCFSCIGSYIHMSPHLFWPRCDVMHAMPLPVPKLVTCRQCNVTQSCVISAPGWLKVTKPPAVGKRCDSLPSGLYLRRCRPRWSSSSSSGSPTCRGAGGML